MANWQCHNQMLPRNSDFSERLAFVFTKYLIGAKANQFRDGVRAKWGLQHTMGNHGKNHGKSSKFHDLRMAELGTNILRT